ncbi:MAG: DUF4417 domain-containing protein [Selenomonadaceae bacterium]|nr:DUF4417 domain-containing protein [Selenomonadaceae bacterium]
MNNKKKMSADCKDVWNAFMVRGAHFPQNGIGIPLCPTTAHELPRELISYTEARATYNRRIERGDKNFFVNAFVHFYQHDHKFDGARCGIWIAPRRAAEIFRHFAGIITPDFSTNLDFPFPWKIFNTYRMRAFGYWYGKLGGAVINNVRWGEEETFGWCFEGIPHNSIVSIGTVASGLHNHENRKLFETGFEKLLDVLKPHTIIVYGSDKYPCLESVRQKVNIVNFKSERALAFEEKYHV